MQIICKGQIESATQKKLYKFICDNYHVVKLCLHHLISGNYLTLMCHFIKLVSGQFSIKLHPVHGIMFHIFYTIC